MKKVSGQPKTIKFGKISLPVSEIVNDYIPQEQKIVGYKNVLENLAFGVQKNLPTLLIGETGLGKTALIRHLAGQTNNGFRRLNLNGQTTVDEFVGRTLLNKDGTYWQDGVLTDALRHGYWLLLDEINAALPEILFVLHSLLDDDRYIVIPENGGEIVRPHENFRIFATMNPSGKYHGTKDLNKAFLSRFPMIIQLEYPKPEEESLIIQSYSKITPKDANNLASMAKDIRSSYFKDEIDTVCSTRDLINCAQMSEDIGMNMALELSVINRASKEDNKAINTIVKLYFGGRAITTEELSLAQLAKIAYEINDDYEKFEMLMTQSFNDLKSYLDKELLSIDPVKFANLIGFLGVALNTIQASSIKRTSSEKMITRYYEAIKEK